MSERKRLVIHEVKLSTGATLLIVGGIVALALHALVPLLSPSGSHAQSMPRTTSMTCRWYQPPASEHPVQIESTCSGSAW